MDSDHEGDTSASESDFSDVAGPSSREEARKKSLDKLQNPERKSTDRRTLTVPEISEPRARAKVKRKPRTSGTDAVIVLKEEKVRQPVFTDHSYGQHVSQLSIG